MAQQEDIELHVVLLPELHDPQNYPFAAEHAKLTDFLEQNGISHLDLAPAFEDVADPFSLWVALDDAHPNALAHRRIAEAALPLLTGEPAGRFGSEARSDAGGAAPAEVIR